MTFASRPRGALPRLVRLAAVAALALGLLGGSGLAAAAMPADAGGACGCMADGGVWCPPPPDW